MLTVPCDGTFKKQVPCVWRMSYSQEALIVWSGHWCTLLQCISFYPIIYSVPSDDLPFQHQIVLPPLFVFHWVAIDIGGIEKVKTV